MICRQSEIAQEGVAVKAIQYLMLLVIVAAGIVGAGLLLKLIPATSDVLPAWASDLLPAVDSPAAGWLIAAIVVVLVLAALIAGAAGRALERRQ